MNRAWTRTLAASATGPTLLALAKPEAKKSRRKNWFRRLFRLSDI